MSNEQCRSVVCDKFVYVDSWDVKSQVVLALAKVAPHVSEVCNTTNNVHKQDETLNNINITTTTTTTTTTATTA